MDRDNVVLYEHAVDTNNCYRIGVSKYKGERCLYIWPFFKHNGQWIANKNKGGIVRSVKFLEGIIKGLLMVKDYLSQIDDQDKMAAQK